jgi:hypothetical protein
LHNKKTQGCKSYIISSEKYGREVRQLPEEI